MPHWKPKSEVAFKAVADGLWQWSAVDSASKRGKTYNCFLIATSRGNVMLHPPDSPGFFAAQRQRIDDLGGVQHVIMTHQGDVKAGWGFAWRAWQPQMHGHTADIAILPRPARVLPFQPLEARFGALEVIHLPGHTPGFVALLGAFGGKRYLFSGHFLVEGVKGWRSTVGDRWIDERIASLGRLETIEADFLMPEYGWAGEIPNAEAPVPFGREVRADAVRQSVAALRPRKQKQSPSPVGRGPG